MVKTTTSFISIFLLVINFSFAQQVLTLQPDSTSGKDALLHGLPSRANVNHGDNEQVAAMAWTFQGIPGTIRTAMQFDLSSLTTTPLTVTTVIDSAFLMLYSPDTTTTGIGLGGHQARSGANNAWINRITSPWDENTVTWNTQPTIDTTNSVPVGVSTAPIQDYVIDVTSIVEDMLLDPSTSFGMMIRLDNENYYRKLNFASSDYFDASKRPKLVVYYNVTTSIKEAKLEKGALEIFPNPAKDVITIENKLSKEIASIEVISISGALVQEFKSTSKKNTLDVSGYNSGIYFVRSRYVDGNYAVKKLIVE